MNDSVGAATSSCRRTCSRDGTSDGDGDVDLCMEQAAALTFHPQSPTSTPNGRIESLDQVFDWIHDSKNCARSYFRKQIAGIRFGAFALSPEDCAQFF